jgi:colicin import membrane protein
VDQAQLELQLKVWKDLAISKQVLMRTAAIALKLDPDCPQDVLKEALENNVKKIGELELKVRLTQEDSRQSLNALDRKLTAATQSEAAAQANAAQLQAAQERAAQELAIERAGVAKELQKLKDRMAEKEKQLKAINTALSDTPENVLKKMNLLKKQKQDEADARRQVETALNTLRTEKRKQDQDLTEAQEKATKLAEQYRAAHALAAKLHEQLKPLLSDQKELPALPDLDAKLLGDEVEGDKEDKEADFRKEPKRAGGRR